MLMGNICNWLLQGNGAINRVLAYCIFFCKMNLIEDKSAVLNSLIIYKELLAWQDKAL